MTWNVPTMIRQNLYSNVPHKKDANCKFLVVVGITSQYKHSACENRVFLLKLFTWKWLTSASATTDADASAAAEVLLFTFSFRVWCNCCCWHLIYTSQWNCLQQTWHQIIQCFFPIHKSTYSLQSPPCNSFCHLSRQVDRMKPVSAIDVITNNRLYELLSLVIFWTETCCLFHSLCRSSCLQYHHLNVNSRSSNSYNNNNITSLFNTCCILHINLCGVMTIMTLWDLTRIQKLKKPSKSNVQHQNKKLKWQKEKKTDLLSPKPHISSNYVCAQLW